MNLRQASLRTPVYQYFDISFNNQTLVDDTGLNRSIEFRVLNERDGGSLAKTSVMLKHWGNPAWESYVPELLRQRWHIFVFHCPQYLRILTICK